MLDARPGVSLRKVAAVRSAVERLGSVRDVAAANLARRRSCPVAVVLPDQGDFVETLAQAFDGTAGAAAAMRTQVRPALPPRTPTPWPASWPGWPPTLMA